MIFQRNLLTTMEQYLDTNHCPFLNQLNFWKNSTVWKDIPMLVLIACQDQKPVLCRPWWWPLQLLPTLFPPWSCLHKRHSQRFKDCLGWDLRRIWIFNPNEMNAVFHYLRVDVDHMRILGLNKKRKKCKKIVIHPLHTSSKIYKNYTNPNHT